MRIAPDGSWRVSYCTRGRPTAREDLYQPTDFGRGPELSRSSTWERLAGGTSRMTSGMLTAAQPPPGPTPQATADLPAPGLG